MTEQGTDNLGTGTGKGQSDEGSGGSQATQTGTGTGEGQPGGEGQGITQLGTGDTDSFFDPRDIEDKPELMAAYKQMQRAFTKKSESIKTQKEKIEAYDAFMKDPVSQIQAMATRMGYQISPVQAGNQQQQQIQGQNFEPQSWDDVFMEAEKRAYDRIKQDLAPVFQQVRTLRQNNLETYLDANCSDWRQYEDEMMTNLQKHPSLVNDPEKLYRISLPLEVLESRATQQALKKLQSKGEGAQLSGASKTTKQPTTGAEPDKPLNFDDAVKFAQKKLAEQGIRPPSGA